MFCKQCGKELADYMCFCPRCGTPAPSAKPIKPATLAVSQTTEQNEVPITGIEEEKQPEKESGKRVKKRKKVIITCVLAAVIVLTALIGVFLVPMLPLHGNRKSHHVLKAELQNVVTPEDNNTIVKFIDEIMPLFAETIKKTNSQTATEQDYMNVIDFCIEKRNTVNTVLARIADSCTNYETNDSSKSTIVFIGAQLNLASLGPKAALFQLKNPPPNHNTENDVEEAFYAIAKFVNEISDVLYGESIFEEYNIDVDFEGAPSNQDTMAADSSEVPVVSETAVSETVPKKAVSETEFLENPEVQRVLGLYSDVFAKAKAGLDISSFVANNSEVAEVGLVDKLNYIAVYDPYVSDPNNDTQLLYAVYDIANDGSPELLIGWNDIASGTDNVIILDIIGFESGKANRLIPVGSLSPRSRASIRKNGVIRIEGYQGSNKTSFSYYTVISGTSNAVLSKRYFLDDWEKAGIYYDIGINYNWDGISNIDKEHIISKTDFEAFEAKYADLTNFVKWTVLNIPNNTPDSADNNESSTTAPSSSNDTGAMSLRGYCLTTDVLNVRTGPGTGYSIIKVLPANSEVYVTGTGKSSDGKTWASIEGGGYVCTDYLVREENVGEYYKTTDALNVRTGPGTGYSKIKVLPARTRVRVMSTETGSDGRIWASLEGGGYACADYLVPD